MLAEDEEAEPSKDFVELGKRILEVAHGITTAFHLTALGKAFIDVVSPPKVARAQYKRRARNRAARSAVQKS